MIDFEASGCSGDCRDNKMRGSFSTLTIYCGEQIFKIITLNLSMLNFFNKSVA